MSSEQLLKEYIGIKRTVMQVVRTIHDNPPSLDKDEMNQFTLEGVIRALDNLDVLFKPESIKIADLAAQLAQERERVRWIPVEERLPEELQVVLVLGTNDNPHSKGYECAWLASGMWTCWFTKDITHWMPLPAPPKGVERDG